MYEEDELVRAYRNFRPRPSVSCIDRILEFLREKYDGELRLAVDLGCGSGQCTQLISKYFDKVIGTDISEGQIKEAIAETRDAQIFNIDYKVSSAHEIPVADQSVQLVIASCAANWFDLPKVYEEGLRVLVPGGVMAFLWFDRTIKDYVYICDPSKNDEINKLMTEVDDMFASRNYLSPAAKVAFERYAGIEIPYSDYLREEGFETDIPYSVSSLIGLIRSYSFFSTYCEKNCGDHAGDKLLEQLRKKLTEVTGICEADYDKLLLVKRVRQILLLGRT